MKNVAMAMVAMIAVLITMSIILFSYDLKLENSAKEFMKAKTKELSQKISLERDAINETLAGKYKKEMEAFASVAKDLESAKQKTKELKKKGGGIREKSGKE